jgi:hypothetical protein
VDSLSIKLQIECRNSLDHVISFSIPAISNLYDHCNNIVNPNLEYRWGYLQNIYFEKLDCLTIVLYFESES